ncbi:hypothetical protein Lfu02_36010 [Longispora fulva]|uniref:Secreted protein n=1 Tax=Longispora fulva TaxID=619741 RepID=A0A8J7KZT0_9ACTN|nr:hypothetical protein [Longispora fulva]MBG6141617.1 hypothetical protein [Longispora fulva]GIG59229.1 hypothetical protein Lfu02_36010 [Longispora fulva]
MVRVLDQLPALIGLTGVVIGGLGTLLTTRLNERSKWQREQRVRWDARRLDTYIAYAAVLKELYAVATRMTAVHRGSATTQVMDHAVGLETLALTDLRRTREWESMLLLGDEPTVVAARNWWLAIVRTERIARQLPAFERPEWDLAVEGVDAARDQFYAAARASLSVDGGSVAQQPYLRTKPWRS